MPVAAGPSCERIDRVPGLRPTGRLSGADELTARDAAVDQAKVTKMVFWA
jgi:hypothetical protein